MSDSSVLLEALVVVDKRDMVGRKRNWTGIVGVVALMAG
jgi:hypothetical protein